MESERYPCAHGIPNVECSYKLHQICGGMHEIGINDYVLMEILARIEWRATWVPAQSVVSAIEDKVNLVARLSHIIPSGHRYQNGRYDHDDAHRDDTTSLEVAVSDTLSLRALKCAYK